MKAAVETSAPVDLNAMSRTELLSMAVKFGLTGLSVAKKADIKAAVEAVM